MLGLGLGLNKTSGGGLAIPSRSDALHYSNSVTDTTRPDRTGTFDRTSVMSKKFVGDGSTYIDSGIIPNEDTVLRVEFNINTTIPSGIYSFAGSQTASDVDQYWLRIFNGSIAFEFMNLNTAGETLSVGKYIIEISKAGMTVNGTLYPLASYSYTAPTKAIFFEALNSNGSPSSRITDFADIYKYEIVHNGETITFIPEEITDPTDNAQTTFYDTSGTYQAQAFLTSATWVQNSVHGVANCDTYGYTLADGATMYKDEAKTLLYTAGQPICAKDNQDGTFSRTESKGWK